MNDICVTDGGFLFGASSNQTFITAQSLAGYGYTDTSGFQFTCYQKINVAEDITNLTAAEGLEVGGQLALVLLAGFTFRAIAQALNVSIKEDSNE